MEKKMCGRITVHAFVLLAILLCTAQSIAGAPSACDLITKEMVEQSSGLTITHVSARDRGAFTSCTFETNNWQVSVGIIYFPGGKIDKDSSALAAELQQEFQRDNAPYTVPEPLPGVGEAAAYYKSAEDDFHAIVMLNGTGKAAGRLIVSAHTRDTVLAVATAIVEEK